MHAARGLLSWQTRRQTQVASLHQQRVKSSTGTPDCPLMWTHIDRWLKTAVELDVNKNFPLGQVRVGWPSHACS